MEIDSKPTQDSFMMVLDGKDGVQYDAFLDLNGNYTTPGGQWFVDLRYKKVGDKSEKWVFLASFDIYKTDTPEDIDKAIDDIIVKANKKIAETFKPEGAGDIPTKPAERLKWILRNGLKELNNVISRA